MYIPDAVTVVLYTTMVTFIEMPHIPSEQYALASLAFFTVSLGGMIVGVAFGLLTALVTKTTTNCRGMIFINHIYFNLQSS